jgi:hypothetical protein
VTSDRILLFCVGFVISVVRTGLSRAELGEELAFGFEPIAAGIARQAEAVAAFGDEVGAGPDHFIGWFRGRCGWNGIWRRLCPSRADAGPLAHQFFSGWPAFLRFEIHGRGVRPVLFGFVGFRFSRHRLIRLARVGMFASGFLAVEQANRVTITDHDHEHQRILQTGGEIVSP